MQSKKTHEQQMRIVEKREKTANAGKDFDAAGDLAKPKAAREAARKGQTLDGRTPELTPDRSIPRGRNQESAHHKENERR